MVLIRIMYSLFVDYSYKNNELLFKLALTSLSVFFLLGSSKRRGAGAFFCNDHLIDSLLTSTFYL